MGLSPTARKSQGERTAESDRRMFAAAVALLIERGIAGTTLAAIGERAGYSRGLVTHRFGSKAGLLAHVHDSVVADWIGRVQAAVGNATGIDALGRVVEALYGFIEEQPDEIRAMYLLRYASIDPCAEYRANVARAHEAQRRDVQRWIDAGKGEGTVARGVDAALAADLLCASVDGMIYRWLVNPRIPIRQMHEELRRQSALLLGVSTQPGSSSLGCKTGSPG